MVFQRRPVRPARPAVIGLAGGVASGKSAVAARFAAHGAVVCDADRICHEALERDEVIARIVARFGDVRQVDGAIDRAALARVFEDRSALRALESILHPIVRRETEAAVGKAAILGVPMVMIDAPLLFETGMERMCDAVIFVDAPAAARKDRAADRGWSPAEWSRRESNQWPLPRKRARSEFVIRNDGDLAALHADVDRLWRALAPTP